MHLYLQNLLLSSIPGDTNVKMHSELTRTLVLHENAWQLVWVKSRPDVSLAQQSP